MLLSVLALSIGQVSADEDILGDWVISGGLVERANETIDVRGSVIVEAGGELRLEGCTLVLNDSASGRAALIVDRSGRLSANDTTFLGCTGKERITILGDTTVVGSRFRNLMAATGRARAISCSGGKVSFIDTTFEDIEGDCLHIATDVEVRGCVMQRIHGNAIVIDNYATTERIDVLVEGCALTGMGEFYYHGPDGIMVYCWSEYPAPSLTIRGTRAERWNDGICVYMMRSSSILVEGCEVLGCAVGVCINQSGEGITLKDNAIGRCDRPVSTGIYVGGYPPLPMMQGNVVDGMGLGYHIVDESYYTSEVLEGLYVVNCTQGIWVDRTQDYGYAEVEIRNSTFRAIKDPNGSFIAGWCVVLDIYDTEHAAGSGAALDGTATIRAHCLLRVANVSWYGGPPIASGEVVLFDEFSGELARIDASMPAACPYIGWEVTRGYRVYRYHADPTMVVDGRTFRGPEIDLWNVSDSPRRVEILDDFPPVIAITAPTDGALFRIAGVTVLGAFQDLGSGMASISWWLDGSQPTTISALTDDGWRIGLVGLGDKVYTLTVGGVDNCGNAATACTVHFQVDTNPPTLELEPLPGCVSTQSLKVRGQSEPGATVTANGSLCDMRDDGSFSVDIPLIEGSNVICVRAVDRAGNVNSTLLTVTRDTIVPILNVTAPTNGTWTNETVVTVTGYVSLDASLDVNGIHVAFSTGRFSCKLQLAEGAFEVSARAVDRAGNEARTALVLNVDWSPPRLEVFSPDRDIVHTTAGYIEFFGEVHDTALGALTVNGTRVGVFMDRFLTGFSVPEGRTSFVLRAEDLASNSVTRSFTVDRDITLPKCTVELVPIGGEMRVAGGKRLVTIPTVEVRVVANEDVMVALGDLVKGPCRECVFHVTLEEGPNAMAVTVHDLAGNMVTPFSWLVTLDTMTPPLEVRSPHQGALTSREMVTVEGLTEPGAVLTVEGKVRAVDDQGFFRLEVPLRKGSNVIDVAVSDAAGHVNSTAIEVTRERRPVSISEDWTIGIVLMVALTTTVAFIVRARRGRSTNAPRARPPAGGGAGRT